MSDHIHSRPFSPEGREKYDRIFRRTDPIHAMTPGTIREYRSDCCGAEYLARRGRGWCLKCEQDCDITLTKIN